MKRPKRALTLLSPIGRGVLATKDSDFWHDRLSIGLVGVSVVIAVATFLLLIPIVRSGLPGAVRYSSLDGGYSLGSSYFPYAVASYSTIIVLLNTVLSVAAYKRSRLASFGLLVGGLATAFFSLVIATALGVAR